MIPMGIIASSISKGVVAPSVLWTPSEISTALWLDADDAATITEVSGKVSQWNDKSGNSRHYAQAAEAKRPVYSANKVVFSGAEYLSLGSNTLLRNIAGVSLFVVNRYSALAANMMSFYVGLPVSIPGSERFQLIYVFSQLKTGTAARDNDDTQVLVYNSIADSVDEQALFGSVVTFSAGSFVHYKNGVSQGSSSALASANTTDENAAVSVVGARADDTRFMVGDIYEVVLVHSAIDTDTRQKIEGSLAHKWGLTASLAGDHPYKTDPPYVPYRLTEDDFVRITEAGDSRILE